ncbi:hypothetical protein DH2020_049354 [Rehmannia glutinosa]|uniref:Sulfotransferase n=1 Tax=Rehmannia glutinosa TaxID=99300 RepID=A0ABR0U3D8_REHGL
MEKKEDPNFSSAPKLELEELLQTLDQKINWDGRKLVKYNGFWFPMPFFPPIISTQNHFKAKESDILLASVPKSGTTWLKALMFCIANRNIYTIDQNPLLTSNPHILVPFLELGLYFHQENPDLQHLSDPRFFSSHIPFNILPNSIRDSECKIIFICRSPLDQFISSYHFLLDNKFEKDAVPLELDEAFDIIRESVVYKYEDLKEDIAFHIEKILEFMGYPFSEEELKQGLVDQIKKLCSLENLKNLEVNKCGYVQGIMKNSSFFRKGEVGDWTNYLTPAMAERVKKAVWPCSAIENNIRQLVAN